MRFTFTVFSTLALTSALCTGPAAWAQSAMDHSHHMPAAKTNATATQTLSEGEVKKIDAEAKTITLKHGVIQNLDMPAMTMAFRAASPELLTKVKPGDKVRFRVERISGAMTVTAIERAP